MLSHELTSSRVPAGSWVRVRLSVRVSVRVRVRVKVRIRARVRRGLRLRLSVTAAMHTMPCGRLL